MFVNTSHYCSSDDDGYNIDDVIYRLLDWRPEPLPGEPSKNERVVIIKNLFAPEDFDKDVQLLLEYQQDVRSECVKCGEVKKVTIYDVSLCFFFLTYFCFFIVHAFS